MKLKKDVKLVQQHAPMETELLGAKRHDASVLCTSLLLGGSPVVKRKAVPASMSSF